jgi:hypothetical protein
LVTHGTDSADPRINALLARKRRIELLKELVPQIRRLAILARPQLSRLHSFLLAN